MFGLVWFNICAFLPWFFHLLASLTLQISQRCLMLWRVCVRQRASCCKTMSIGDSLNMMAEAWHNLLHIFSICDPSLFPESPLGQGEYSILAPHFPLNMSVLQHHPVQLFMLSVDTGNTLSPPYRGISERNSLMQQQLAYNQTLLLRYGL